MKLTQITNPVALRRDTTIGTRIFAGNTMIYGDIGWRDVTPLFSSGLSPNNTGTVEIRRTTNNIELALKKVLLPAGEGPVTMGILPPGYRPLYREATSSVMVWNNAGATQGITVDFSGTIWWVSQLKDRVNHTTTRPTEPIEGVIRLVATGWPSILP